VLQTTSAVFLNERFSAYCRRRFSSLATMRIAGLGRFVLVWEPELVREVFTGDPDVLRGGEANARFLMGALGPSSVMVLDGERHVRMRRLLSPAFHGAAVRRYAELVDEATATEIDRWPLGREIALRPRFQAIALEVILRAVIGVRDRERESALRAALGRVARANLFAFRAEAVAPGLVDAPAAALAPWLRARREANRLIREEIAAHRADPEGREDILAMLIAAAGPDDAPLTDDELRDQLVTLLVAGHESTATALAWSVERLVRHPTVLARLQRELLAGDGEAYLDAVVNETLRVRPVIDVVARRLAAPVRLAGYTIPPGTTVAASIRSAQINEAYDHPEAFRPERFLDGSPPPYALIPFGGGTHRCLGASFAVMEMKGILRAVLRRVVLRSPADRRAEQQVRWKRITTTPSRDGRVVVTALGPGAQR